MVAIESYTVNLKALVALCMAIHSITMFKSFFFFLTVLKSLCNSVGTFASHFEGACLQM